MFIYKIIIAIKICFLLKSKRNSIKEYLYDIDRKKEKLVLNHCSMNSRLLSCTPQFISFVTIEVVMKNECLRGVIIFDFPGEELIKYIIDKNNLNWDL